MFIHWSRKLEIGDPIVDSEHRYLIELINNFHQQFHTNHREQNLISVFNHLANYVRVHFENEEALMHAIEYPDLSEHRRIHEKLIQQVIALSEDFIDGEKNVTENLLEFLKQWALNHIAETDLKIRKYLSDERPSSLTARPAFSTGSGSDFKSCTLCGKKWPTYREFKDDPNKVLKGVQSDQTNHLYNLILFNCSCGTTLGMFLKEFIPVADIPFEIEAHSGSEDVPEYCLNKELGGRCLKKCACKYTSQLVATLS